jgi:hypothetical protein
VAICAKIPNRASVYRHPVGRGRRRDRDVRSVQLGGEACRARPNHDDHYAGTGPFGDDHDPRAQR